MKICLRCGKEFAFVNGLYAHYNKKKICDSLFLDVSYIEMKNNYKNLYSLFEAKKNCTKTNKNKHKNTNSLPHSSHSIELLFVQRRHTFIVIYVQFCIF